MDFRTRGEDAGLWLLCSAGDLRYGSLKITPKPKSPDLLRYMMRLAARRLDAQSQVVRGTENHTVLYYSRV